MMDEVLDGNQNLQTQSSPVEANAAGEQLIELLHPEFVDLILRQSKV